MNKADTAAILVCAGNATRMGGIHKILHPLGKTTVLHQVLRSFCQCESIAELLAICREQDTDEFWCCLAEIEHLLSKPVTVIADTTAMGDPVEIEYTLTFYADSVGGKGRVPQEATKTVIGIALIIMIVGGIANYFVKRRRK